MEKIEDIKKIANQFGIEPENIAPCGNGHIHDTYCITTNDKKYLLQRINGNVFASPENIVNNIFRVTYYLERKGANALHIVPSKRGKFCIRLNGSYWRVYDYIDDAVCLEEFNDEELYQIAFAFGQFQHYLDGFDADVLFVPIQDFHNTPVRFANLLTAVKNDACSRVDSAIEEIEFFKARKDFYPIFEQAKEEGTLPVRVTHNDTKTNNVMLDKNTKKAKCVVDLDTVMPGYSVNDFGDMVRFATNTAKEDEKDLDKVHFDIKAFENCVHGFLDGCQNSLTAKEYSLLCEGAKMMTLECGMRFLEDYLKGDTYFKTKYPEHNLVRCRTQIKLVKEMEECFDQMKSIVNKYQKV